jgi:ribonuclease Z
MLLQVQAGPYRIRGVSVGGVYTSLLVPELDALLDVGLAPRSSAGAGRLFLSHGHADHAGALHALLGLRNLTRAGKRLRIFLPAAIAGALADELEAISRLQRYHDDVDLVPMEPGDEADLGRGLRVRAFRTYHRVPSLGYLFVRKVDKLRPELAGLPGAEIARRRRAGDDVTYPSEHLELAYATDTLPRVLEAEPALADVRVLILECTFLDERKSVELARASCHIHLDDLLPLAAGLRVQHLVLMHFSQIYPPAEVHAILRRRLPPTLHDRLVAFAPTGGDWPG